MSQLVFLHGPGAGACADAYCQQLAHFAGSVAPTLPGHLEGTRCPDVIRYTEWVRGNWIRAATDSAVPFKPNAATLVSAVRRWDATRDSVERRFYGSRIPVR